MAPIIDSSITSEYYLPIEQEPLEQDEHPALLIGRPDLADAHGAEDAILWSELVPKVENILLTFLSLQCGQARPLESLSERTRTSKTFSHLWH
jgi:hypothetical protein